MRKSAKILLSNIGLLTAAQHAYFNVKTATPSVLRRELQYRLGHMPDALALPPARLIYDVIACRWAAVFYDSGQTIVDDMLELLARHGLSLRPPMSVLDFGCGCGRLIRHVGRMPDLDLHGSDYNPRLISWCRTHLPFAQFETNGLAPPLPYETNRFDFIYARSVLTHLDERLQRAWMKELQRVLKPDGMLYFTMHGRPLARGLTDSQRRTFEAGQLVTVFADREGQNLCASFASRNYVENNLLDGFELIDFVEGRDREHLHQDIYLVKKQA